jgi:hypothetical protein
MKDMMVNDAKPTAKAGTKGDPTPEQVEQERQEKFARRPQQGRGGYYRGGYQRGFNRGRGGFNRGRGFGRGGYGRGAYHNSHQQPRNLEQQPERTNHDTVENKTAGQQHLDVLAKAVEKSAAVMEQHTAALAQFFCDTKN